MKMNKYEEAYESVYQLICELESIKTGVDAYCVYDEDLEALGELVEKETPKPLDYEGDGYVDGELNYDTAICRSCGRKFEVDYDEHSKYCPDCGQRLDWGENGE